MSALARHRTARRSVARNRGTGDGRGAEPADDVCRADGSHPASISVRFLRSPAPDLVCKPDIGYEVLGGAFATWRDVGGFPNAPCDDPDIGYKFSSLEVNTSYTLSIRAYRITDGVKEYSTVSDLTASTLASTTVSPPEGVHALLLPRAFATSYAREPLHDDQ